jgi:hypothetical protein
MKRILVAAVVATFALGSAAMAQDELGHARGNARR